MFDRVGAYDDGVGKAVLDAISASLNLSTNHELSVTADTIYGAYFSGKGVIMSDQEFAVCLRDYPNEFLAAYTRYLIDLRSSNLVVSSEDSVVARIGQDITRELLDRIAAEGGLN